ncbi:exopolysaccharide biosynthesis protein [Marinivivus vitaminiproducens]|uniref:exopolysaccharide biosynthesis protein n=1 Tax=Marinivivus vitaminiproducens TaxID=3035935 RepID=UPI0027A875A3|nr:exopolysaccharide biosynthesis protein [Geminicoccaceae bacterium SCSIO 64248]
MSGERVCARLGVGADTDAESHQRFSSLLRAAADDHTRDRVTIADLRDTFQDTAFGALIFIFAVPNVLPVSILGVSAITGLPLVLLAYQIMCGGRVPWLPPWILKRSFSRTQFQRLIDRIEPGVIRLERYLRPRLHGLFHPLCERALGAICLVLAIILFLPIPLGNMLPGVALSLAGLALIERDGIALAVSVVTAVASVVVVSGAVYAMALAAFFVAHHALGF